ncbi:MAG: glycoside hydrolase family 16 protein [Janthinobacterium lividum]
MFPLTHFSLRTAVQLAALLGLGTGCTEELQKPLPAADAVVAAPNADAHPFADYTNVVWADEFAGTSLDQTKWVYELKDTWYNNELQATTNRADNLTVSGGFLNIIAKAESYHNKNYTSARINTKGKQDFGYGRLDVRAKLPQGKGIWPAIWMLGTNDDAVGWPACGEIDIMELRGSDPTRNLTTMHFGTSPADHKQKGTIYALPGATAANNLATSFHTYSVLRSRDKLEFFLDGVSYYSFSTADASPYPFNNPFYAILNLAVGGDFDGNPDATTVFPQTLQVDYVRFSQY